MNYEKIYSDFIKDRRSKEEDLDFYENHHIKPVCVGGSNDDCNLIKLTPEDHYFAHLILVKIYSKIGNQHQVNKLIYSANMMANMSPNGIFRTNHKYVGWLRRMFIENHPNKRPETRKKISDGLKLFYKNKNNEELHELNLSGVFPFTPIKYILDDDMRMCIVRDNTEANRNRSDGMKRHLKSISDEQKRIRHERSLLKYVSDREWQKKRGLSISKSKKGKTTNQNEIMGKRYASMTNNEFEDFLKTKKVSGHKRLITLRNRYLNE